MIATDRQIAAKRPGLTDDDIWHRHIKECDDAIAFQQSEINDMQEEKKRNKLALQVRERLGSIPDANHLDRLLKYETAIKRQFYKVIGQLEQVQRLRAVENIPAPLKIDLDVNPLRAGEKYQYELEIQRHALQFVISGEKFFYQNCS